MGGLCRTLFPRKWLILCNRGKYRKKGLHTLAMVGLFVSIICRTPTTSSKMFRVVILFCCSQSSRLHITLFRPFFFFFHSAQRCHSPLIPDDYINYLHSLKKHSKIVVFGCLPLNLMNRGGKQIVNLPLSADVLISASVNRFNPELNLLLFYVFL